MINYSPRAARAIGQLKSHYNDVEVFVEDTGNHNMWLLIIRSMLPPGTKLESVTMLGGRGAVTSACEMDQEFDGRKKIYVIDGDLDFLLGRRTPKLHHFYKIRANNIENLLLHEEALINIAMEHQVKKIERVIRYELDFQKTIDGIEEVFRPLFVAYAVVQRLNPEIATTSYSVHKFLLNKKGGAIVDFRKVVKRIFSLYRLLAKSISLKKIRITRDIIARRASKLDFCQVASGKDYVMPIVLLRFQKIFGYGKGAENFKVALSRSYSPNFEPDFAQRVSALFA